MSDDLSLFGDDSPIEPVTPVPTDTPIANWQIDLLRKALDVRGLDTMAERRQAIEASAGRAVDSLRALTNNEALKVLNGLGQASGSARPATSSWDDREGDTWIDRL